MSKEELLELKEAMNQKALTKKRIKTATTIAANIMVALVVLLPLLYAVSIAFMPSGELFTTDWNLLPKSPTLQNFKDALTKVPLLRFIGNSFLVAGCITIGQIISCSLAAFSFSFLEFKGKGILFMLVMATMIGSRRSNDYFQLFNRWADGNFGYIPSFNLPYLTSAMGIFLFRQFYMSFPASPI